MNDRILIGEFVRRHHARLAHEIAVSGVPGPTGTRIGLKNVPPDLAELAGLVARSHGLHLRECVPYLASTDPREYKGVHAVFLMALLRVADYLQMHQERAPQQLLQVRTLRSPRSEREWRTHHAVIDIRNTHSDPEAIFVQAAPDDAKTYLKLKRLLQGLQAELDSCWAVLGEVYGRFGALANLGLVIRRVRTNLDDEKGFAATVPYIPCNARFDAVGADLLKLLIQPLYGDKPEIGIRELMQNAADACVELKDFLEQYPLPHAPDLVDQGAEVVITLEEEPDGSRYVTVSDRGIGMTSSVVLDYFLKAGASFRRSDAWRQQHESAAGESRVLRSGRFGVGALAAFLLGDEIEVSTRHISTPSGGAVSFTAGLDTEEIQLNHCTRPVGTTVRVRISNGNVWDALTQWRWEYGDSSDAASNTLRQWDFYCISNLNVQRVLIKDTVRTVLPQRLSFPTAGADLSPPWHRLSIPGYANVQWAYDPRAEHLVCNGILVSEKREAWGRTERILEHGFSFLRPTVSVFDPDGQLPLNLQRTGLAVRDLPFKNQLWHSMCEDFVAWTLANAPAAPPVAPGEGHAKHPAFIYEKPRSTFAYTAEGSILVESWAFRQISPSKVISFPSAAGLGFPPGPNELFIPLDMKGSGSDARKVWFRCSLGWNWRGGLEPFDIEAAGHRTIVRTDFYETLRKPGVVARFIWDTITVGPSNERWTVLSSGACDGGRVDFGALLDSPASAELDGLTEWFGVTHLVPDRRHGVSPIESKEHWPLSAVWGRISAQAVIPYDSDRRKERYRQAYETMQPMIDYYEKAREKKSDS